MVCPKCGRVLLEGEICPCSVNDVAKRTIEIMMEEDDKRIEEEKLQRQKEKELREKKEKAAQQAEAFKNMTADISGNIIQHVSTILKNPKEGIKEFFEEENFINSLILCGIQAILFGVFVTAAISSSLYAILSIFGGGFLTGQILTFGTKFAIFIMTVLASLAGSAANAFSFFTVSKIQKHTVDFKSCLSLSASKAVIVSPLYLISLILTVINGNLGLLSIIISVIAGISFDSVGINIISKDEDKNAYYLIIVETITMIALFILISIISAIIL